MDGIDHYKRAEELAERLASGHGSDYSRPIFATLAQTHATLALAAATADATAFKRALAKANGVDLNAKPKAAPKPVNLLDDEDM
ncbi:hypothetical protein OG784_18745 [Streptomyces sp. NBC_01617]|uniref:hypothetical protein n=1 Tax=Streptomyces sp. NBC_01617 TaxID=2975899 RepID=UPI00386843C0|nr:hypothetical protein OG784_18745 [Streptomyces sp. NBC_01617]